MKESIHAIIVFKRINNDKKIEVLQYEDKRWNSLLFPNCKLNDEKDSYIEQVVKFLTESNIVDKEASYDITLKKDIVHTKFSETAKENKIYHHYIYLVECDVSILNGEYNWYTLEELKQNTRVMKTNSDIISFVEEILK